MDVVGIDIGFGFTKATNGDDLVVYKSVYGESTDIQFREHISGHGQPVEHLHIEIDDNAYFVGELAEMQSNVRFFTLDQSQLVEKFAKPLALAALTRLTERNIPVKLVTGLPVSHYRQYRETLGRQLLGRHNVTVIDANGERRETVVSVGNVRVIPQPMGSLFNLMLNERGGAGERRFLEEKIGVIDIGFRTADYSIANRTNYQERGSRTTDSGISHAFSIIANKLQERSGVNVELYRLYDAVERGSIKIRGKNFELAKITEHVFGQLASDIATEVNRLWADDWDIDTIVITGGGGKVLTPYLQPLLEGEVLAQGPSEDSRFANVRGYWKYAKHLWDRGNGAPSQGGTAAAG